MNAGASWPRDYFSRLLPELRSRLAFLLAFLLALGLSIAWLVPTIRGKWLYGLSHPAQSVTYERARVVPARHVRNRAHGHKRQRAGASHHVSHIRGQQQQQRRRARAR